MQYKTWYIIPTSTYDSVEPEVKDFRKLSSSTNYTYVERSNFKSSFSLIKDELTSRLYTIIEAEPHLCRETMLDDIDDVIRKSKAGSFLKGMRVFILMEERLSDKLTEKVMKFGGTFFGSSICPYHLYKMGDKLVLTYRYDNSSPLSQAWAASLFLHIFQKENIMDDLLKNFKQSNTTALYSYLTTAFLKNNDWGNSSNPCLPLSLFCYHQANYLAFSQESFMGEGPVNAAYSFTKPNVLMNYVIDVFSKIMKMPSVKFKSDGFSGNPGGNFVSAFNSTLELCYKARAYDEIMEKRRKAALRRAAKK